MTHFSKPNEFNSALIYASSLWCQGVKARIETIQLKKWSLAIFFLNRTKIVTEGIKNVCEWKLCSKCLMFFLSRFTAMCGLLWLNMVLYGLLMVLYGRFMVLYSVLLQNIYLIGLKLRSSKSSVQLAAAGYRRPKQQQRPNGRCVPRGRAQWAGRRTLWIFPFQNIKCAYQRSIYN